MGFGILEATPIAKALMPVPCANAVYEKGEAEFHPVRMSWIVITDLAGNRRLQMCWRMNR